MTPTHYIVISSAGWTLTVLLLGLLIGFIGGYVAGSGSRR